MSAVHAIALPCALCLLLVACTDDRPVGETAASEEPAYVGSRSCETCHAEQFSTWESSQHFLAMQTATPATVLADFNDASFGYAGINYRFSMRDGSLRLEE